MDVRLDTSLELLLQARGGAAEPGVLATVVSTAGSTYRKAGARMLIRPDGSYAGLLSGGCLEADLAGHARELLQGGTASAVDYDLRGPDDLLFGIGAGCEGAMRVLLEPVGPGRTSATALALAAQSVAAGRPAVLIVVHHSADVALGTYALGDEQGGRQLPAALLAAAQHARATASSSSIELAHGRTRALVQYLGPAPHLLICGAGPDAQPVARSALDLGWRVTVIDHRPAYAAAARFAGARVICGAAAELARLVDLAACHAAIVMSHHLASDTHYLKALAAADSPHFVGLLGPRARRIRLATEIGALTERLQGRLRGPVGLDIGAVTPEGIALAIIAQIHGWLAEQPRAAPASSPAS